MSYLRGFAPWIGFIVLSQLGWQCGALGAAVLAAAMLLHDRRTGAPWDTQILAIGAIAFFAVLAPIAVADPNSAIEGYVGAMSSAWLALVAWTSIAIGTPFTLGFARQEAPAEIWELPAFRHLNVVITAVWAGAFTVSAIAGILLMGQSGIVHVLVTATSFAAPMVFTRMYVARVQARHADPVDDAQSSEVVAQIA